MVWRHNPIAVASNLHHGAKGGQMPPLTGAGEEMAGGFYKDAAPMALPLPEVSLRALVNNVGNGISAARFFEWRRSESSRGSAHGGAKSFRVSRRSSFKGK